MQKREQDWQSSVKSAEIAGKFSEGTTFKWKTDGMKIKSALHTLGLNSKIGWIGKVC